MPRRVAEHRAQRAGAGPFGASGIGLLEVEPDLARFLAPEQLAEAQEFLLPVAEVDADGDLEQLLDRAGAFGALVTDGLLVQAVSIDGHATLRVIGPGALVPLARAPLPMPVGAATLVAPTRARVVVLGKELLIAAHRWPWIVATLHTRAVEQAQLLTAQLAICQLPRVEDRLMGMMWLLSETWGRVTHSGVRLELALSHEALGKLIGARRPTVSLALKELAEQGALIRQDTEWLILAQPPEPQTAGLESHRLLTGDPGCPGDLAAAPQPPPTASPEEARRSSPRSDDHFARAASLREEAVALRAHSAALIETARRRALDHEERTVTRSTANGREPSPAVVDGRPSAR